MRRAVGRALCRRAHWITATLFSAAVQVRSVVFGLVAVFVTVSGFTAVAAAGDWEMCRKTQEENLIAACSGAINSGTLRGNDLSTAYINRGVGWSAQGEYGKAIQDFKEAINSDSNNAIAYYDIANAYTITHDYKQAIKNYDEAIRLHPKYVNAFSNRCFVYNTMGLYDRAIEDCNNAIVLSSRTKAKAFVGLANAYSQKRDHDQAMKNYDEAIGLDPNNISAIIGQGKVYLHMGNDTLALAKFDEAVDLQPTDPTALNNRCWGRAIAGQVEQALKDCNDAISFAPTDAAAYDSRAFTYLKSGNLKNSIDDYSKALFLDPDRAYSYYGRGCARLMSGDSQGADDIKHATDITPTIADDFPKLALPCQLAN